VNNDVVNSESVGHFTTPPLAFVYNRRDDSRWCRHTLHLPLSSVQTSPWFVAGWADATSREEVMVRWVEFSGYVASSLVFLTFYMRGTASLRLIALCSNAAFLIYAGSLHLLPILLLPILLLHGALIPGNVCRLRSAWQSGTLPGLLSATVSSGINSMNYRAFTNDSLTMMHAGIREALGVDDTLVSRGEETRFSVRETADWKRHAADLETEMIRREMVFEVIDWSSGQSAFSHNILSAIRQRPLTDHIQHPAA